MAFKIEVGGLSRVKERFGAMNGDINRACAKALNHAGDTVANVSRQSAPIGTTGKLSASIKVTKQAGPRTLTAVVGSKSKYAPFVELGTKPHFPPVAALRPWAAKFLGNEKLAFVVARSIARHGTKGQKFMKAGAKIAYKTVKNEVTNAIANVIAKG